jgi:hypothetical protein
MTRFSKAQSQAQSLETPSVFRFIEWYEKNGDVPLGVEALQDISLSELQALFGQSQDNPMYDAYPISAIHTQSLQNKLSHMIDLERYDYYLSCHSD